MRPTWCRSPNDAFYFGVVPILAKAAAVYGISAAEIGRASIIGQGRKVEARKGHLIIAPAGFTHTHRGHVPASGDKYFATSWILFRQAEELFGLPAG
jgi:hypothetical protein